MAARSPSPIFCLLSRRNGDAAEDAKSPDIGSGLFAVLVLLLANKLVMLSVGILPLALPGAVQRSMHGGEPTLFWGVEGAAAIAAHLLDIPQKGM